MQQSTETKVVWRPIAGSSQELALDSRAHHTLYCGSRGPGKTDTQLMRFRRRVGLGYGEFWRGIIFDREYKNLDDLIAKSKRWFNAFDDGAKFLSSNSDLKWVWPTGEELLFRQAKNIADYDKYHGQEFPFIGFNELTKWPTSDVYDRLTSINRTSFRPEDYPLEDGSLLPQLPLEVFSTTNPSGAGHAWVKRRFIDVAPYGEVVKQEVEVFNPRTQKNEIITKKQVTIFGSYRENIYLTPEYVADLVTQSDENLRKAWELGSWDIVAGGAIGDLWDSAVHILPQFKVPENWRVDRGMDWGSSHPCSIGWFAIANGEEVQMPDGRYFCPPAGTIIQIAEIYYTQAIGTNKGLRKSATDIANDIKEYEIGMMDAEWIVNQPYPGPADNQIRDVRESDVDTIEKKMAKVGIRWLESDKSPGSRRNGLQLMRDRLEASKRGEGPGLYFMRNCQASIQTLPTLPRDDTKIDDVDTTAEDHVYDMVRYRVLHGTNSYAKQFKLHQAA